MDKQQFSNPVKVHLNKSFTGEGRVESTELTLLTFNLQNCYTQLVASSSFLQSPQYYCVCVLCTMHYDKGYKTEIGHHDAIYSTINVNIK